VVPGVKPFGIHVTSVLPGYYRTDWSGRSRHHSQHRIVDWIVDR
jgi:NAD(P)-dependent dehydrogenase (short-subunit alcohol dehydrogenase family)